MTLNSQRRLDACAGTVLRLLLAPMAALLGRILRRPHDLGSASTITILKLRGAGSLAIAYPALLGLRRAPRVRHLRIVTTRSMAPFAHALGIFDEILVCEAFGCVRTMAWLFRCEAIVDLEMHSRLTNVFCLLTCARNRIGFYTNGRSRRANLATHLLYCNPSGKVYEAYDQVARLFGATVPPLEECTRELRRSLGLPEERAAIGRSAIGIAPACSALRKERMLRPAEWIPIVRSRGRMAAPFHLLGGEPDRSLLEELAGLLRAEAPDAALNIHAGLPLEWSLRQIAELREVLCVDSAMLHFARLLGTPTVSYWGPSDPATLLRPAASARDEIYYERISCSPCVYTALRAPCRGNNLCMRLVSDPQRPRFDPLNAGQVRDGVHGPRTAASGAAGFDSESLDGGIPGACRSEAGNARARSG